MSRLHSYTQLTFIYNQTRFNRAEYYKTYMVDDADDNADNAPATFSAEVDDDDAAVCPAVFAAFPSSTVSAIIMKTASLGLLSSVLFVSFYINI